MKKIFRNIMTLMTVPFMLMTSACESMDDTNVDPTRMNTANAGSFLDPLIYGMGTYTWTRYNSWTFQLMQCLVTTNSTSGVGWFNISDTAGDGVWTNYYKWNTNAKAIYDEAVKMGDPNYQAIALTLRCWIFENTTDAFGDIPVQESCRGEEQLYYPKFESQTDVYRFIIDNLDVANSIYNLKKGLQFNTNGDKMYCSSGSDLQGILKWKKFTNSLRLRALLRVIDSKELGDLAKAELKKMLADPTTYPVFESNDDNAKVHISGIAPDEAPMTRPSDLSAYKSLSAFFIDRLQDWKDPRLEVFATQATNKDPQTGQEVTSFIGLPSGYDVEPTLLLLLQMRQIWPQRHRIYSVSPMQRYSSSRQSWHNAVLSLMMPSCSMKKLLLQLLRNGELRFLTGILITGRQHMMERFAASWNRSSMHSSSLISSNGLSIIVPVILMYRKVQV